MTDHVIEVIELALAVEDTSGLSSPDHYRGLACRIRAAVTSLIRAAALEEAGQAAMDCDVSRCDAYMARRDIAVAIHALKEQQQADELDRHTLMGPSSDFNEL